MMLFHSFIPTKCAKKEKEKLKKAMVLSGFEMLVEVSFEFGTVLDTFVGRRQTTTNFSMKYGS